MTENVWIKYPCEYIIKSPNLASNSFYYMNEKGIDLKRSDNMLVVQRSCKLNDKQSLKMIQVVEEDSKRCCMSWPHIFVRLVFRTSVVLT